MQNNPLKIIFAGTPAFALPCLQTLLDSEHQVCAVYTQPDRQAGRGRKLTASPVKLLAQANDIPIFQPPSLRDETEQAIIKDMACDLMIVVAYGLILPLPVLTAPRLGCINVHASLLPRWRGAAPIQHALLADDKETGITIMQMEAGLDTGPMLNKLHCPIDATETSQTLHDKLAALGAEALLTTLADLQAERATPIKQDESQACYAAKIEKQDGLLNWQDSVNKLDRQIRAYNPWPIAYTQLQDQRLRIWRATLLDQPSQAAPGTIIDISKQGIDVATGNGILRLQTLQLPGGKPLSAADIINSKKSLFQCGFQLG